MPRQLRPPSVAPDRMTTVAPINKGGSGATSKLQAVSNIGGISRTIRNQPHGVLAAGADGYISSSVLTALGIGAGFSIQGPDHIVRGGTARYFITNFISQQAMDVSVSAGSVTQVGEEILVTAPATGSSLTLSINGREIMIELVDFGPIQPSVIQPTHEGEVSQRFAVFGEPYASYPVDYDTWSAYESGLDEFLDAPAGATGIEVEARRHTAGQVQVRVGTRQYGFGVSTLVRDIDLRGQTQVHLLVTGTGQARYRWRYPSTVHVATDWEVATDALFQNLVFSSYDDVDNLTSLALNLPLGVYYVRHRYYGEHD